MAAMMWQPAVARETRGACGGGQQGRERTTGRGHPSRRWRGGSGKAVGQGRIIAPAAGGQSRARARGRRGEGSGGPVWKFQEF
jgi:hypothetical protein